MTDWHIGTIRVFVQELKDDADETIARLNPFSGGTTLHFFGYDDKMTKLGGLVVGKVDEDALIAMERTTDTYELMTPWGSWGDFYIKHVACQLTKTLCQTLRPDLPENSPVFKFDLDLYYDE